MIFLDALSLYSGGARTHLRALFGHPGVPNMTVLTTPTLWNELAFEGGARPMFAPDKTRNAVYRAVWRLVNLRKLVRASGATLYFDPAGGAPSLDLPRVTMVQNMLPFDARVEEWYGRLTYQGRRLALLRKRALQALASAEGTIFISQWSRKRVVDHLGKEPAFSCVVPHGVEHRLPERGIAGPPRILYVSDVEPYKRQIETVIAYDLARCQGVPLRGLVLAGSFTYRPYERRLRAVISRLRHKDEIELTGWLGKSALKERMQEADVFLFASSVECCPNILLEFLSAGKPVICSMEPPMPEFAEDAVVYVNPAEPLSISEGIRRVARMSDSEREVLARRGLELAKRYDWAKTARETWEFLARVADRGRSRVPR